ncbi:hypothetical protein [Candidatus Pantoea floridensis]|jgi:hypothetical protein|uniref:Glycosyl transferase family 8 n=1 Tax=Candidatus Pantoea floridensis TaxID=1938870 RepID=A0A286BRI5_9GAMM|nr:hypothetical protein [Pantoea floridensis]PIF23312.1 hypothetical protein BX596_2755 [Enterobacteriaceae bacterium JKS000233]SOD36765.1 hypothetical protein SAMN06273570_1078 [Pantoea floridensis]HBZ15006.1 hypothetical protein [Pantoea sp.]
MIIAMVLRSGGEYNARHVHWLHRQLPKGYRIVCFSDVNIEGIETIPLQYDWPGWWAKMELFRPDIPDDIFYLDLDTVITGDITGMLSVHRPMMLKDFYNPQQFGSGLMFIPHEAKARVWSAFLKNPEEHMNHCSTPECWGDQGFISREMEGITAWQSVFFDQVVSYKAHVMHSANPKPGELPMNTRICCFHGKPRPWDLRIPYHWLPKFN